MRSFYLISILLVILLALSPFALLKKTDSEFSGKIVAHNIYSAKVKSIDPATCGDTTSAGIQANFYEGLYAYHYLKRPVEIVSLLADGMPEISPDGLTYRVKIKKGIKYSRNACFGLDEKGQAKTRTLRADDFVLAFKRIADFHITTPLSLALIQGKIQGLDDYRQNTRRYRKGDFSRYTKEQISGIKALDEHTLEIKLTKSFPQLLYVLAIHSYAPIPDELIDYHLATRADEKGGRESIPENERNPEILEVPAAIGTGPYVLKEWIKGGKILMVRNPDFREFFYPAEGGPGDTEAGLLADAGKKVPFIDIINLTFVAEANPSWMLFLTKQRDTAGIPREVYSSVISPSKELTQRWEKRGIRLIKSNAPAVFWFAFNMDDKVLGKSKSLRQALNLAFDVEQYIEVIYNGRGIRAVNTLPSSFKGYEQAGPSPYSRLDIEEAKKKIAQAKAELIAAGVIKTGDDIPPITLDMPGTDEHYRRVGEFTQGQFRKIGIELKVEMNDWPTLQKKVHNKQTQVYAMGWHADYPDAENFLQLYYSPNIKLGTNNTNYSNPLFDTFFEQASAEMDEQKRVELYVKMVKILNEDCPMVLLSEPIYFTLAYDWMHNIKPHPIGYGFRKFIRLDAELRHKRGGM